MQTKDRNQRIIDTIQPSSLNKNQSFSQTPITPDAKFSPNASKRSSKILTYGSLVIFLSFFCIFLVMILGMFNALNSKPGISNVKNYSFYKSEQMTVDANVGEGVIKSKMFVKVISVNDYKNINVYNDSTEGKYIAILIEVRNYNGFTVNDIERSFRIENASGNRYYPEFSIKVEPKLKTIFEKNSTTVGSLVYNVNISEKDLKLIYTLPSVAPPGKIVIQL